MPGYCIAYVGGYMPYAALDAREYAAGAYRDAGCELNAEYAAEALSSGGVGYVWGREPGWLKFGGMLLVG